MLKIINRHIAKAIQKSPKSVLLLGPRQVGKSTLIESLKPDLSINLADEFELMRFSSSPHELQKLIENNQPNSVYIDEIQRLPRLLNSIQAIIDKNKKIKFYLTGSSARKLRGGGANLLPGRVLYYTLGPFVASEFNYELNTRKILEYGSLPEVYLNSKTELNEQLLRSYTAIYLKEEIKAEALTRNLESFARFLNESILNVARFIDLTKISKNAKISRHSAPRYFEILEDTLIGQRVFPFPNLLEELDLIRHPKFYFFDNGVFNGLMGNYKASQDRVGVLAEQLVFSQLVHSAASKAVDIKIYSFRTRSDVEVDFIVEVGSKVYAIEVKTSASVSMDDLEGLNFFKSHFKKYEKLFVFHMEDKVKPKAFGDVLSLSWQSGLKQMGL